ncbi:alanine/ornithine racemase family PLP-dependent enzyme [Celeribacter sp.]|uniref:alanine/ornithine racemase family PLP-dependent enzyme n=1 Tax=Celeribacter sp. TaxID=1890673 RepID=UPI003A944A7D
MTCPRLEVDLHKLRHNTKTLAKRLQTRGIGLTAVTKAVRGHPAIARAMLDGGAVGLAEARLSNVKRLRQAGIRSPITLIRTPMLSQVDDIVHLCDTSYNTEMSVISALAVAAMRQNTVHGIILMVEMGDMREGIMPHDLGDMARHVMDTPGVVLTGIGTNFACLSGIAPTAAKMRAFSALADDIEVQCGPLLETVSGGNSANLPWAFGTHATGRINDLRIGEALLLGVDPLTGTPIDGLFQDAFTLVAEVIETDAKSLRPFVSYADITLAGIRLVPDSRDATRIILAIGYQDTDADGLSIPSGHRFIGATSDHLVLGTTGTNGTTTHGVGSQMRFQMNYSALMRTMAAPDIPTKLLNDRSAPHARDVQGPIEHLARV